MAEQDQKLVNIEYSDASKFYKSIAASNEDIWGEREFQFIYRGQKNSSYTLLPKAWRVNNGDPLANELFKIFRNKYSILGLNNKAIDLFASVLSKKSRDLLGETERTRTIDIYAQIATEYELAYLFLREADLLGLPSFSYDKSLRGKDLINGYFVDHNNFFSNSSLEAFAIAQHHGVPTRLLDWSTNPIHAVLFACLDHLANPSEGKLTLFGLRRNTLPYLKDNELEIKVISAPGHENKYLHVQRGVFTYIKNPYHYYIQNGKWPSIEDVIQLNARKPFTERSLLIKLTLPTSEVKELTKLILKDKGSLSYLMPHYDKIYSNLKIEFDLRDGYQVIMSDK